jgi:hypothetical protein
MALLKTDLILPIWQKMCGEIDSEVLSLGLNTCDFCVFSQNIPFKIPKRETVLFVNLKLVLYHQLLHF